ncbi:hypothetical protein IAU60_001136 [Kwoniella sp. DSM 27419]
MVPRLAVYGMASTALAGSVVYSALSSRANFYAAAVAVGRSSGALMILANFTLFNAICLGIGLKKVFFGQLRAIEYEHLFERLWIFLTESLLALTIFRDDFSAPFAFMYGLLLFLKCFHWITADRVDYMDQIPPPGPPKSFHLRIASIIFLLASFDLILATYSIDAILTEGVSAMVLFASEFTILQASILGIVARYVVNLIDLRRAGGRADAPSWEEKSMYMFYIDLAVDFVKLLTYLCFFSVILLHYGLPLHILRDVYMTLRSFMARCGDLIRYRRATRDMDALYPDATEEELARNGDRTCIICREEMIPRGSAREAEIRADPAEAEAAGAAGGPNETPKKLACGHVFHFHCLRSWLERQQSCPTCRRDVLRTPAPPPAQAAAERAGNALAHGPAPPPPAPGAVPTIPPTPVPETADANAMRQAYNEYFSTPRFGLDNPVPVGAPMTDAQATAGPSVRAENDDTRIQRGIWGGPVVPGRFFAPPLGAAPRLTPNLGSTGAGPSVPATSRPVIRTTPAPQASTSAVGSEHTGAIRRNLSATHLSAPGTPHMQSGSNTPFSSNPPVVFTPTGTTKSLLEHREGEDQTDARRLAAEAALRRFGLGGSAAVAAGVIGKGKGKERDDGATTPTAAEISPDQWDSKPTHFARLAPQTSSFLANGRPGDGNLASDADSTVQSLDERLRVLREVDETIWGLIGELTKLRSSWAGQEAPVAGAEVEREETLLDESRS